MTYTLISLVLFLLTVISFAFVLLVPVALLSGNVFHVWGTSSAWEWASEALRRVFAGGIRRRFMRAVNAQRDIAVDGSRRTCAYVAVSISTTDVQALAGPGGDLARVAVDAASSYLRYGQANDLSRDVRPQVVVVPEEWRRRGSIKARSVSGSEFLELRLGMLAWHQGRNDVDLQPVAVEYSVPETSVVSDDDVTVAGGLSQTATERLDLSGTETRASVAQRLVLTDVRGAQYPVSSESVTIGRGHDCEVRFNGPEVSREHVDVYCQQGTWWLRDRGSRNGTVVDGHQVQGAGPVRLHTGSVVILGSEADGEQLTVARPGEL